MATPGLATNNLRVTSILNILGISSPRDIFYNTQGDLRTSNEIGNIVTGTLDSTYCPGSTRAIRLSNLRNDRKLSYFKGYQHSMQWNLINNSCGFNTVIGHDMIVESGLITIFGGGYGTGIETYDSTDGGNSFDYSNFNSRKNVSYIVAKKIGNYYYIFKGMYYDGSNYVTTKDVCSSYNNTYSWTLNGSNTPSRAYYALEVIGTSIYLIGGYKDGNYAYKNDVWESTNAGNAWTQIESSTPWSKRNSHSSVIDSNNNIYIFGGNTSNGNVNDVWKKDYSTSNWTQVSSNSSWSARRGHETIIDSNDNIYLFGGEDNNGNLLNDLWKSTDYGVNWNIVNTTNDPPARKYFGMDYYDGKIWLSAGNGDVTLDDLYSIRIG